MINKITLNEKNYGEVIEKLQALCNKYRMYNIYTVINSDDTVNYSNKSYGLISRLIPDDTIPEGCRRESMYVKNVAFINVTKHYIKEKYDDGTAEKWYIDLYEKYQPLIHLDLGGGGSLVLHSNDVVKIYKNGFTTYTSDVIFESNDKKYIHKFFTDYISVIEDLELERNERLKEWEELADQWDSATLKISEDEYESDIETELLNATQEDDEELDNDYVEYCSHDANEYFYQLPKDDLEDFAIESGDLEAFNDLQEEDNSENKNKKNDYILPLMSAYNALKRTSNYDE